MKTFRFLRCTLLIVTLLCFSACSEEEIPSPNPNPEETKSEISIDASIITNGLSFSSEKGELSVSFKTNEDWTLNIATSQNGETWCVASATSGTKGNTTVKFAVSENTSYDDRSVSVTIKSGTASKNFTITQKCAYALLLTSNKYELNQMGGTIEIEVKSNIDYEMEVAESAKTWITENTTRALTTHKHAFDIAINEESKKREGEIHFKSGDKVETVKVYQTSGAIIMLTQNEYTVSSYGESISVDIKSNIEYGVQMPDVDWIIDEASTRGMSSHTLIYTIAPNNGDDSRTAEIVFYDKNSDVKDTLKITQEAFNGILIHQDIAGTLAELLVDYDYDTIEILKIIGDINTDDIEFINSNLNNLQILDIGDTTLHTLQIGATNVSQIILPKNLKIIKKEAFNYSKLVSIDIPSSVEIIETESFSYNSHLKKVNFQKGSNLKTVEGGYYAGRNSHPVGAFSNCDSLESVVIPSSVTVIKGGAFYQCKSLKHIYFEENSNLEEFEGEVQYYYGRGAFDGCSSLQEITIPKTVKKIGYLTFSDCTSLKNVIFEEDSQLEVIEGNYYFDSKSFGAFQNCSSLTGIDLPSNLQEIGYAAFKNCSALEYVKFGHGSKLKYIRGSHGGAGNVPASYEWSFGAFAHCTSLKSITIPQSVEDIGKSTFYGCTALKDIIFEKNSKIQELHGNVNEKGYHTGVFSGCSSLESIIIPASVHTIHYSAFSGCESLENVSFENNSALELIEGDNDNTEYSVFYKCNKLKTFDASNCNLLTNIGGYTFYGKKDLTVVKLGTTTPPQLGNKVFYGISNTAKLVVPQGSINAYKEYEEWFNVIEEY